MNSNQKESLTKLFKLTNIDSVNNFDEFDWNGRWCEIIIRDCWIEMFDVKTGESLLSVAVFDSGATIRERVSTESKGWSKFKSIKAPAGYYVAHNDIKQFLNEINQ